MAINDLRSVCRIQINLTSTPPIKLIEIQTNPKLKKLTKTGKIRNKPYPPNLSKTPAKIIEPETGASTWAEYNVLYTANTDTHSMVIAKAYFHFIQTRKI
jgi:hypothetical protein